MTSKSGFIGRCILFSVIFVVTAVVTFLAIHFNTDAKGTISITEASLPLVSVKTESGMLYNRMHGITGEIDEMLLDTDVTLLPSDKELALVIDTYNETIKTLGYKIRAVEDGSLIENTEVKSFDTVEGQVQATLNIKNLIRDNTPYILEIIIGTEKYEEISYYTTIYAGTDYKLQDKLDYVLDFNECTFDLEKLNEITKYLETKSSASNDNYGKVDIYSTKAMVGWGDLKPFVESNIVPSVLDINEETAIITLDYTIGAANDNESYDTYLVHEFYRIRQTSSRFYLLSFDRETTQIFDGRYDLISSGKINLGVNPDTEAEVMADEKNKYIYFENCGTLWCFDKEKHTYTKVFAFESEDTDNVRERYDQYSTKIMSVNEDGRCRFLVYGYMNRGAHEGEVGISLYDYSYAENVVTESIYIPVNVPHDILCGNVAEIAYVKDDTAFYIKIDDNLYSIDLVSKEAMTEAEGLSEGSYYVSADGKIIAYHVDGGADGADKVRVFNIEKGSDYYIEAGENEKVKALGFVQNDLIYGIADKANIVADENGGTIFAMHRLYIMDSEFKIIRDYEPSGTYVVSAETDGYRINLNRVVKDADGTFRSASIDQLINREENVDATTVTVDTIVTESRKTEVVLKLADGLSGSGAAGVRTSDKIEYKKDQTFELPQPITGEGKYYTYGGGKFKKAYGDIADAINYAVDNYGDIYDYKHNLIWKRFKTAEANIKGLSSSGCSAASSYGVAKSIVEGYAAASEIKWLKIEGVQAEKVLSFVGLDCPVIGETIDGYVIITGYTSKQITYLNTMTGAYETVSITEADKMFSQCGDNYLTYYKE